MSLHPSLQCRLVNDGPRILVADGDESRREWVSAELGALGCICVEADDGRRVVDLATRGRIDLLVVHLDLPLLDGAGLTQALAALPAPPRLVVHSDRPFDLAWHKGLLHGATCFFHTHDSSQLVAAVAGLLRLDASAIC
ncbi:MAG TPA: response regulator [Polyangia bacterium]